MKNNQTVGVATRACTVGVLLVASTAAAQQALLVANEDTSAVAFSQQAGRVVTFVCASTGRPREIWGTDVYSIDSPICTAAVHAGVRAAGTSAQVWIRIGTAAVELQGTQRNGITSLPYARVDYTYSFVANSEPAQIGWNTTFDRVPDDFTAPITVQCPPNGNRDSIVIGTDVYRADSAICVAAVHAGVIGVDAGGRVTLTLQPKRSPLVASVRNGVSSSSWSSSDYATYPQPYSVTPGAIAVTARASAGATSTAPSPAVSAPPTTTLPRTPRTSTPARQSQPRQSTRTAPAAVSERTPPPPAGPYTPGPRTIDLVGFVARGSAPAIVPRLISTPGFTAVGTAPVIVPRTISTSGWSGTGSTAN